MLTILSPAKSLDFQSPSTSQIHTQPIFQQEALELVEQLRILAPQDLCQLMKISDKLGSLNAARFQEWQLPFTFENAKSAVLAFTGDVYMGLDASSLDDSSLEFGQRHLAILSGLYGLLKPMDLIQAYRLEMGTKFSNTRGKDIHSFWRSLVTKELKKCLTEQVTPVLVNLASKEYFQAVDTKQLNKRIITPVFKDWKNNQYKIINFYAKKARGLMTRFILQEKIDQPDNLKDFELEGYRFNPSMSEGDSWVFTRRLA
ncbi:MAG TPA: peroxide stress protein YaaA [Marinospirillum sp.]|uniref:peroxide stress protein YaaA n=1 Tax=Marinospirillum sp. TaxID=2183934 RepID=UPI002B4876B9|nr:peroxide stress protein YaaA [Marinospirillum sp.]HKM15241.1 peroxide stress protein YaaA [Marinospirillum sp.]